MPEQPSGLGWMPDGSLLVVSRKDFKVLRRTPDGELTEHADLSDLASGHLNDMVVDGAGRKEEEIARGIWFHGRPAAR